MTTILLIKEEALTLAREYKATAYIDKGGNEEEEKLVDCMLVTQSYFLYQRRQ
jgi:hypothetical protein